MCGFNSRDFNILIVDDVPKNLQVLGSILRPQGYNVEFATSGRQALQWIKGQVFDLVLLDIMMPEISGFEVCEEIRKAEAYRDIPIIFLTAKTDNESIVKGFELGAQDYVTKPFEANELLSRVKTHLQLKHSKALLGETNKWLEKEVAARTAQLEAAQKELEVLDQAKTEFLHMLNHELRTPLNGIIGGLTLIRDLELPPETAMFINMLDVSAGRLEKFSYKVLDISELRSKGRESLNLGRCNLVEIIRQVMEKMTTIASGKDVTLNPAFIQHTNPVMVDRVRISNILCDIVDNAIKFSAAGGTVDLLVGSDHSGTFCQIKDQGTGFSEYALQQLFKPFSNTKHHIDNNIGLSLYYAKLVMDAHGGVITVGSNSTGGSIVSLAIPA